MPFATSLPYSWWSCSYCSDFLVGSKAAHSQEIPYSSITKSFLIWWPTSFFFVPKHAFVTLAMQDDFFHQLGTCRHSHIKYFDYIHIVTSIVDRSHWEWSILSNIWISLVWSIRLSNGSFCRVVWQHFFHAWKKGEPRLRKYIFLLGGTSPWWIRTAWQRHKGLCHAYTLKGIWCVI